MLGIDSLIGLKSVFDRIPRKQETAHDSPPAGPHPSDHGRCSFIQQTLIKGFGGPGSCSWHGPCSSILAIGRVDRHRGMSLGVPFCPSNAFPEKAERPLRTSGRAAAAAARGSRKDTEAFLTRCVELNVAPG